MTLLCTGEQEEFQTEKEDLLAALRESQRQLKLKELLLANFVPPREIAKVRPPPPTVAHRDRCSGCSQAQGLLTTASFVIAAGVSRAVGGP